MKVYVASSWRNKPRQQEVVRALREAGHDVYDFCNPPKSTGFSWTEVDEKWREWTEEEFREALSHWRAVQGFNSDMDALRESDACVLVQPCGRSAHLELGWAVGAGKKTLVLLAPGQEAELMLAMVGRSVDALCSKMSEVLEALAPKPTPKGTPGQK